MADTSAKNVKVKKQNLDDNKASCGLNPREFRILKTKRFQLEKKKGVLDGNLLWLFITLERSLQDELTAAMGTTVDIVLDNLLEIDLLNTFF